jgi:selenocysteine lyase/cysteine desulfurase
VNWTNRWNEYSYVTDVEAREDGGTPGFMQGFRIALSIELKEQMGVENIEEREKQLLDMAFRELPKVKGLKILADNVKNRLGVISFYIEGIHHNLLTRLLNDLYGIQVRGGCSCAGTYGHFLLNVDYDQSHSITDHIDLGDFSLKPGWVRLSIHPTMTDNELIKIVAALKEISENIDEYKDQYLINKSTNEFQHKDYDKDYDAIFKNWFLSEL